MSSPAPLPVGQRPRCLNCTKELRPNFDPQLGRPFRREELEAWQKANPKQFLGTYGGYRDNRFCGLRCGYHYAVKITRNPLR